MLLIVINDDSSYVVERAFGRNRDEAVSESSTILDQFRVFSPRNWFISINQLFLIEFQNKHSRDADHLEPTHHSGFVYWQNVPPGTNNRSVQRLAPFFSSTLHMELNGDVLFRVM